jgi:CRISPR-associated endonuclease/helicase Cas3
MAITTQVCEMSLDLDADVLITEWAPVSALVQRFGRANRHGKRGPDFRATLHTYKPDQALPYRDAELQAAQSFLAALSGEDISQRELAEKLVEHSPKEGSLVQGSARFLSGGYFAVPGQFRDADDFTASCVLSADLDQATQRHARREPLDPLLVPVPRGSPGLLPPDAHPDVLPRHIGVADAGYYNPTLGFMSARSL